MQPTKADLVGISIAAGVFASGLLYYLFRWREGASPSEVRGLGALVFLLGFIVIGMAYAVGLNSLRSIPVSSESLARSQKTLHLFSKRHCSIRWMFPDLFVHRCCTCGAQAISMPPNGTSTIYSYDPASQVTQIIHQLTATSTPFNQASYAYNSVDKRTSLTDRRGSQAFGYDSLDRLTSASHPLFATPQSFAYDLVGNCKTNGAWSTQRSVHSGPASTIVTHH